MHSLSAKCKQFQSGEGIFPIFLHKIFTVKLKLFKFNEISYNSVNKQINS